MITNYFKIYLRTVTNNKLFTALNILSLSLGIATLVLALLYWINEHNYEKWNPNSSKTFEVLNIENEDSESVESPWQVAALMSSTDSGNSEIEAFCYYQGWLKDQYPMQIGGQRVVLDKVMNTQKSFFDVFPFEITAGSKEAFESHVNSVALEEKESLRLFGHTDVIGSQWVDFQGMSYVVRALYILPESALVNAKVIIGDLDQAIQKENQDWGNFNYNLIVKLKSEASQSHVESKLSRLYIENLEEANAKMIGLSLDQYEQKYGLIKVKLSPLDKIRLHAITTQLPSGLAQVLFMRIMICLALLLLTLSLINYVNFSTSVLLKRYKEIGVKRTLGASHGQILVQFVFETAVLTGLVLFIALVGTELLLPYFNYLVDKNLSLSIWKIFPYLLGIGAAILLVAGVIPVWFVMRFTISQTLNKFEGLKTNAMLWRKVLQVIQFSIAFFFIIGSFLLNSQVNLLINKDLGFQGKQVININYKPYIEDKLAYYTQFKSKLQSVEGVESVGISTFSFDKDRSSISSLSYEDTFVSAYMAGIDFGYFELMKMGIVQGRDLDSTIAQDSISSVLVNEQFIKQMQLTSPIGKEILRGNNKLTIIGVVKDFDLFSVEKEVPAMVFFYPKVIPWISYNLNTVVVKIDSQNPAKTVDLLEQFWLSEVDPNHPFTYEFADRQFAQVYQGFLKQRMLFRILNWVVIFVSLFGLFALVSVTIEGKLKEIAIRKVLGAQRLDLLYNLTKQYALYCLIGFLIALVPVMLLMQAWLNNFVNRIDISPIPFLVSFIVLESLTIIVVVVRCWSATKVDILKQLSYE